MSSSRSLFQSFKELNMPNNLNDLVQRKLGVGVGAGTDKEDDSRAVIEVEVDQVASLTASLN